MTVLKSLLSTFRESRSRSRKSRRHELPSTPSVELLEDRLLLANPDTFHSNLGGTKIIYLDFDGHTETDAAWTGGGSSIVTPAFSADADGANFSDLDRLTIEEIFLRVSEDFAPFADIDVTTEEPVTFNQGEVILVSIGGRGRRTNVNHWSGRSYNDAKIGGFTNTNLSNTVFVFPRDYTSHLQTRPAGTTAGQRAGELGRDVANGVTEAVGMAMGLNELARPWTTIVSPLVTSGSSHAVGWRDTWSDALGQDDINTLTTGASGLQVRDDDHGNGFATATSVVPISGNQVIGGMIERNDDVDLFHFNTAATTATFSVEGSLDLTQRVSTLNVANPSFTNIGVSNAGTNLDPVITLYDVNGNILASDDPPFSSVTPNASLKPSITFDLEAGDYYLEVSNRVEYGNLGPYDLTVSGIDAPSATPVVGLQSNPGADVTFFLDFNGARVTEDEIIVGRADGINQPFFVPPFDTDGDKSSFSAAEETEIIEIFERTAEDFAPFDINVTTLDPFLYGFRQGLQVVIGGDGTWAVQGGTGYAALNTFGTGTGDNMAIAFSELLSSNKEIALETSAAIANALGIETHLEFDSGGTATGNRAPGFPAWGAIGGDSVNSLRDIFLNWPGSNPVPQDPLAIITGSDNRISYRPDDHGNDISTATIINLTTDDETLTGVIETNTDVDLFAFETRASNATISVSGLDLTVTSNGQAVPGVTNPGANLDPVLELLDENGLVIAADGDFIPAIPENESNPSSLKASLNRVIPGGRYFIRIKSQKDPAVIDYGNIGTYTITIEGVDGTDVSLSFVPPDPDNPSRIAVAENEGLVVGIGRLDRPRGQPTNVPVVVDLFSTDMSELMVPPRVTIQPGQTFASFDVTAVDDTILDGEQRVVVEAWIGGVGTGTLNSTAILRVEDHETIEATITPVPLKEDAGPGGATLTISRSNTDIDAEDHWVAVGDELRRYDANGNLEFTETIEWPVGVRPLVEIAHDVQVLQDGSVAVFNGTGTAFLSIYNVTTDVWSHFAEPGLSANTTADSTIGGITSIGDFVFLSDFESFDGDLRGIVRINTFTGAVDRFADSSVGSRLFVDNDSSVIEINPVTGEILQTILIPAGATGSRVVGAVAFDGTAIWVAIENTLVNGIFLNPGPLELLKISPDTGDVLETHVIPGQFATFSQGMTIMNGLIYINDFVTSNFFFSRGIQTYNPATRQLLGGLVSIETLNNISIGGSIGSLPSANRLLVTGVPNTGTGAFGADQIYEINPVTGRVEDSFVVPGGGFGFGGFFGFDGISGISDVVIGGNTYDDLIYLNSTVNGIRVFQRNGIEIDVNPGTSPIDPVPNNGFSVGVDIGGADVPGVTAQDQSFRDVTIGLGDELLYGLLDSGSEIAIHDPFTLAREGSIQLDAVVNSIAVDEDGNVLGGGANGIVTLFDPNGVTISSLNTSLGEITDVETNVSQAVIVGDILGQVTTGTMDGILTSDPGQFVLLENVGATAFVSFGRHPTLPTGDLFVSLNSDDLSELQVPPEIQIPVGQSSVTVQIDVIDDNLLDGAQDVNLSGITDNYVTVPLTVSVGDAETVGVEILPDSVTETDGTIANGIRVFRTDVDGPFDVPSTTEGAINDSVTIVDDDVTLSRISIRPQEAIITDVNVTVGLEHSFIPDLDVFLVSPSGTRVELFTDLGSNETAMTDTVFDDEAATRIVDGVAPFTGSFIPEELLTKFDGEDPSGTWTLEVVDDNITDSGVLLDWSLDIKTLGLSETMITLKTSDESEAVVSLIDVVIPPATAEVFVDLEAIDDSIVDGTQTPIVSVDATNLVGFDLGSDTVDVLDIETLTIEMTNVVIAESDGATATMATITRSDTDRQAPLLVTLVSNDPTELSVPLTVPIPINSESVTFPVGAVDDLDFDGDQNVTFTATAPGYQPVTSPEVTVTDQEPRIVMTTLSQGVSENVGTITISLSRLDASDLSVPQSVTLHSNDLTELTVPSTFLIPINAISTTFKATVLEDDLLDGPQTVTITATDVNTTNPAVNSGTLQVIVEDAETVEISVPAGGESLFENSATGQTATVTLSAVNPTEDVVVSLANNDLTEASIPSEVIIPAGTTTATFTIGAVNDTAVDGDQIVTLTGSAPQYLDGVLQIVVKDHEPPTPIGPDFVTEDATPAVQWAPVEDATRYDLWVNDLSRNIVQLYRLENLPATGPFFSENFEDGSFATNGWTNSGAEIDDLALNEQNGALSAHLNGDPDLGDLLQTPTMDLSSRVGVQVKYDFQQTGSGESPGDGEDLVVSYFNSNGEWVVLERKSGADPDMTVFSTSVVQLPEDAMHAEFALRFETTGKIIQDEVEGVYDDWFVDNIEFSEYEQFVPPQQLGVGLYRYWVRAYDRLEQAGFWSPGRDFKVRTRPEITNPAPNAQAAQSGAPTISWTTVVDSSSDLWVNNLTTGESQVIREQNLETTSYATSLAGLAGGSYKAWVRAIAPDGFDGFWSTPVTFTILSAPTGLRPTGATFDHTPELGWNPVAGAANYDVWLTNRTRGQDARVVLRDQFVNGTSLDVEQDLDFGDYALWVRAVGADGTQSAWSEVAEFTVGGRPSVTSPVDESVGASPAVFTWTGISGSSHYEFWINRIDVPINKVVYDPAVVTTSFILDSPLDAGQYRLWVRAISDMGEKSAWSTPTDFTVVAAETKFNEIGALNNSGSPQEMITTSQSVQSNPAFQATLVVSPLEQFESIGRGDVTRERQVAVKASESPVNIPISESTSEEVVDSVMADWHTAGWWETEPASEDKQSSVAPLAAAFGLGLLGRRRRTGNSDQGNGSKKIR